MQKKFWIRWQIVSMMGILCLGAFHADDVIKGIKSPQKVMLNGRDVEISAYNIQDENYFKLRDIAALLSDTDKAFDVIYNQDKNIVEVTTDKKYRKIQGDLAPLKEGEVSALKSPQVLEVDLKNQDVKAYNIHGNNYYRLRDLGRILNFDVEYNRAYNKVMVFSEYEVPAAVSEGEIKTEMYIDEDGSKVFKKIYPDEIMNAPMRTCYPRAPKGEIVYDILERGYFNDKGEPVNEYGERINRSYRERMANLMKVKPFELDLRDIKTVDLGGTGGDWKSH